MIGKMQFIFIVNNHYFMAVYASAMILKHSAADV